MRTESVGRIWHSTPPGVNAAILHDTVAAVARCAAAGPGAIARRLEALDREWDIERVTMLSATIDALATLGLGLWRGRRWLVGGLAFLGGSMLAHVIIGQCPSLPLYRRLGVRTRSEIDFERYALKAARGDFEALPRGDARRLVEAMQR